jgi:CBS-domain-containing membrane protein
VLWPSLGILLGLGFVGELADLVNQPLIIPPFGATAVLAFGLPQSPLAQPRNVIGGHVVSAAMGFVVLALGIGVDSIGAIALAGALALAAMLLTGTVHPPAGATALVVVGLNPSLDFLLAPVLAGSAALIFIALVFNNLPSDQRYPLYWQ